MNKDITGGLKVLATAMVFFCHCAIVCKESFGYYPDYLDTPAWGGVFIFLTIGGMLSYIGFGSNKYTFDRRGVGKYYYGRFRKILLPTWIFVSLAYIFNMSTAKVSLKDVLLFLTCTFNGSIDGGCILGVGATWYVFIIMWLYLLSPLFYKALIAIENHFENKLKVDVVLLIIICFLGEVYRITGCHFGLNWHAWLYANVLGCIDLYLIGFIAGRIAALNKDIIPKKTGNMAVVLLLALILLCCAKGYSWPIQKFYMFVSPTVWAMLTVLIILGLENADASSSIAVAAFRVLSKAAPYSFAFYLWHSMLMSYVADKTCFIENKYVHVFVTLIFGFIVTAYISYLWNMIVKNIAKTESK